MNRNLQILTLSEQKLFERFIQFDEKKLAPATKIIVEKYKNQVFVYDIFSIIVEDVLNSLSLNEWDDTLYDKILLTAESICNRTRCFFPASDHFLFAISIVWITYCCKYKNCFRILTPNFENRCIINDSKQLEYSLCAQFFNYFAGPPTGKAKELEKYMFKIYGKHYRSMQKNNDHVINFQTLLYFLSVTNFSYEPLLNI